MLSSCSIVITETKHSDHLITLELENERLQRQLLLLQEQNVQAKHRRKDEREGRHRRVKDRVRVSTAEKRDGLVPPLDVGYDNQLHYNLKALYREWAPVRDELKDKIDKDLQNKYGYNLVARRVKPIEFSYRDGYRAVTHEGFRNFLPKKVEWIEDENDNKDLPYHKSYLTSKKLNRLETNLRKDYASTSVPNLRSEDIDFRLGQRDLREQLDDIRQYDAKTQFEDEFFIDTARTDEETGNKPKKKGHYSRPQLIVEKSEEVV